MSIFNELLPKLFDISNNTVKIFNDELQTALDCLDKFEGDYHNGRSSAKDKSQRDKTLMTTLQCINEDDDEQNKTPETAKLTEKETEKAPDNGKKRVSKKRSKDEVEGISSPEQDKRAKRNASVKAQSIISKQVNVNLSAKLRRDDATDQKSRRRKEGDKENAVPLIPPVHIKQEKISLPPEPMDTESLPLVVPVKEEPRDHMPPPAAPVPKPRKAVQKEKEKQKEGTESGEEDGGSKRSTRTRKQTDTMPPPPAPVASARSTRASSRSSRANRPTDTSDAPEPRPKRTRAKKKVSDSWVTDEKAPSQTTDESAPTSPAEKPRPKRTRRGKNAEKEAQKLEESQRDQDRSTKDQEKPTKDQEKPTKDQEKNTKDQAKSTRDQDKLTQDQEKLTKDQQKLLKDQEKLAKDQNQLVKDQEKVTKDQKTGKDQEDLPLIAPKQERLSQPQSPVLQKKTKKQIAEEKKAKKAQKNNQQNETQDKPDSSAASHMTLDETRVIPTTMNVTVTLNHDMDKTVVLPNGVYNHAPSTPQHVLSNETVVLDKHSRETVVLEKNANVNDATVVLEKDPKPDYLTDDNSLLTDDSDPNPRTPPQPNQPNPGTPTQPNPAQPSSAVKEKVQQFEELAARTTRTKTRAMAKMEDTDNHTPPDKMIKPVLSQETLNKMNNMIFNGKPLQQVSSSACKPRAIPTKPTASASASASASKASALQRQREAADREREDARSKKEALLEAKREAQRRKREEKMANAAAAREAAERERKAAMEAAARERLEKQLHADQGKLERLREVERKKLELARKVAETEERRRLEEQARIHRLEEEQRKADLARRKQLEEAEAMKKDALMAKEIEKKQKEYLEKQRREKMHTPLKTLGTPGCYPQEPVYMADGFQYLNSDEDEEPVQRPVPAWSTSKARKIFLHHQSQIPASHIDKLFSVRVHSPDLREIFPNIERSRLKRTSSAVWRTPPRLPPLAE